MRNQSIVVNNTGFMFADGQPFLQPIRFIMQFGWDKIEHTLKNGKYIVPTGQPLRVLVSHTGFNVELLSQLTGGAVTAGAARLQDETLTKSTNTLTLTQTPKDTNALVVQPIGTDVAPLLPVGSSPSLGEYSISGTTVTLNASQPETTFKCIYVYDDVTNGDQMQLDPDDFPSTVKMFGIISLEDINVRNKGYLITELAKCQRDSAFNLGAQTGSPSPLELEYNVINAIPGDVKIHVFAE